MRYISALKNATGYLRLMKLMTILLVVPPVGMILVLLLIHGSQSQGDSDMPPQFYFLIIAGILVSLVSFYVVKLIVNRQISIEVEISSDGIRHLAPGKERTIAWGDIRKAVILKRGNRSAVLKLKLQKGSYTFDPFLIPDQPDGPRITFKLGGPKWVLTDGTSIRMSVENSVGYRAVLENRPELL